MKAFLPVVLILISIGLFFFQINPLFSDVKQLQAESRAYDDAIKNARELEEIRSNLSAKLASFSKSDLDRLDHFLPRRLDTVRIILDIDGIATRNGLRIEGMNVSDTSGSKNINMPAIAYNTAGVSFNFSGTYIQGVRFMQDLQRSLRLFDIVELTVKPSSKTSVSSALYDFKVILQGYWLNK